MMRKRMCVLLALVMLLSVTPVQAVPAGSAVEKLPTITVTSPEYADIVLAEKTAENTLTQCGKLDFGGSYLSVEEAAIQVREAMKRRETSIVVGFYTTETDLSAVIKDVASRAMAHTGNPTEGDYLLMQLDEYSASAKFLQGTVDGVPLYQLTTTYSVAYRTDAAQEAEMDVAVAALLESLDLDRADDYTKFMTVYGYICDNITYDYDNLQDETYLLKHTAYAALIHKTAVCQGYAVLLYRLMLELGIDCRYISGIGNGGAHGWNIVKLNGKYYNVDSTWDAGYTSYSWCLLSQENFTDHIRGEEYDTMAFHSAYPMGAADYVYIGVTYGDATGDGIVNGQDLIRLKKYIANYNYETGVSTIEIAAGADATGDGLVNGQDLIRLKKYIANFNYETGESTVPLGPQ